MDITKLIRESGSVRRFKLTPISDKLLKKILEAGIWGPSIFGVQPWYFVATKKKGIIKKIAHVVKNGTKRKTGGLAKLLVLTANIIEGSKVLIAAYTNDKVIATVSRYGKLYKEKARIAELLSIGAAMQNMFLVLNHFKLGGVWLDVPTLFSAKINKILKQNNKLVVFLAIGFPNQKNQRSHRNFKDLIKII